ncbi:hypothetical protein KY327_01845, partial [Candidatus Woesearchaeota archaeon]|nr:hypothetical protein [Candidatus Woesearchaeota archaeon]
MTDEYELLPADELDRLRKEVERLKANPLGGTEKGDTLMESVDNLTASVNKLIRIFSDVDQEMVREYEKVRSVNHELEELKEQNKKIASGILTVAKMVEDGKGSSGESKGSKGDGWSGDGSQEPPSFSEENSRGQDQPSHQSGSSQQPSQASFVPQSQASPLSPQQSQQPSQAPPPQAGPKPLAQSQDVWGNQEQAFSTFDTSHQSHTPPSPPQQPQDP